jgi:hypothetical protein
MSTSTSAKASDAEAFDAFEAAGWERQAPGYDEFFGQVTSRLIEPLLDAAEVGGGEQCSMSPPVRATPPPPPRFAVRDSRA